MNLGIPRRGDIRINLGVEAIDQSSGHIGTFFLR